MNHVSRTTYHVPRIKKLLRVSCCGLCDQEGQTLIETMLAIFILTTSLVAGLGLAIYVLNSQAVSKNQIVATNLAREGIEVIRMFRDSNWLLAEPDPASPDPDLTDDLQSCPDLGGTPCYPKVYDAPFRALNPASYPAFADANYRLNFNPTTRVWSTDTSDDYSLYLQADKSYSHAQNGQSVFARQVKLSFAPITDGSCSAVCNNRTLIVKSIVAWRGKNCTEFSTGDLESLSTSCKILVEEHLANWKDYK